MGWGVFEQTVLQLTKHIRILLILLEREKGRAAGSIPRGA
jgi:hypothetical protein